MAEERGGSLRDAFEYFECQFRFRERKISISIFEVPFYSVPTGLGSA